MCGILGIFGDFNPEGAEARLRAMAGVMAHRGPDGEGYHVERGCALGHRRLSIIDLEGGAQPLGNERGDLLVSFNGEIYNFREVREELEGLGHRFSTDTDTETIIHAYEEYGEECTSKLRGMFAFALWDRSRQKLFLARDRLGKKPLYYWTDGNRLIFASEIKALLQNDEVSRELDHGALRDYFTYLYVPFPATIFKEIKKLPPATQLSVTLGGSELKMRFQEYWDFRMEPDESRSEQEWIDELEARLFDAVKVRMISDVPIGAFLSGGIDSSTVVALMSQLSSRPIKTFSVGFEEQDYNEVAYARMVAKRYGTDHQEYVVKPDALEVLPKLAWQYDEPFADSSALPTYYLSEIARRNVTVALSGDGGDEVFAGYGRYPYYLKYSAFDKMPLTLLKPLLGLASAFMPEGFKGKGVLRHISANPFMRYAGMVTHTPPGYLPNLMSLRLQGQLEIGRALTDYPFLRRFYDRHDDGAIDPVSRIQYVDAKTYLAEDILTKVDRASMLCSLETRAPLLDHKLIEFMGTMPRRFKLKNGDKKNILKKTMEKHLPAEILYRRKMGFDLPVKRWFSQDFGEWAGDLLLSEKARARGLFNEAYIKKMLDAHRRPGVDLSARLWSLVFFELWCRNWVDR